MRKVIIFLCTIMTFSLCHAQNDQIILEALGQKKSFMPKNSAKTKNYGAIVIASFTAVKEANRKDFKSDKYKTLYREFTITANCSTKTVDEVICKTRQKGGIKQARCRKMNLSFIAESICR